MDILGEKHFPNSGAVLFIWPADKTEAPAKVTVNGHQFTIQPNVKVLAATPIFVALDNSGFVIERLPDPASPPAPGAEDGDDTGGASGGGAAGADTFDADAVIAGTVDDVVTKLAGLSPEHLAAVKAAETDREKPRKGVTDAIDALLPPAE